MSVDVKSEGIRRLVDENVEVEQLGTGFTFTEGPIWNPDGQFLLFSDMPGDTRRRWDESSGAQESTTRSPCFRSVTSLPTSSTTPAPSCPRTTGSSVGWIPWATWRSEWQTPLAAIRTSTSPAFGGSSSSSSTTSGSPNARRTAALMCSLIRRRRGR